MKKFIAICMIVFVISGLFAGDIFTGMSFSGSMGIYGSPSPYKYKSNNTSATETSSVSFVFAFNIYGGNRVNKYFSWGGELQVIAYDSYSDLEAFCGNVFIKVNLWCPLYFKIGLGAGLIRYPEVGSSALYISPSFTESLGWEWEAGNTTWFVECGITAFIDGGEGKKLKGEKSGIEMFMGKCDYTIGVRIYL